MARRHRCEGIFVVALISGAVLTGETKAEYAPDPSFFVCTNATGYYDIPATNDWRTSLQTTDPQAMQEISGKWYAEFYSQENNVTYNNTFAYNPDGGLEFTTRTCGVAYGMQRCTDDYGHGRFTARRDPSGWIFVARNVTSMTRVNSCGGFFMRMENGIFVDQSGTRWQRIP